MPSATRSTQPSVIRVLWCGALLLLAGLGKRGTRCLVRFTGDQALLMDNDGAYIHGEGELFRAPSMVFQDTRGALFAEPRDVFTVSMLGLLRELAASCPSGTILVDGCLVLVVCGEHAWLTSVLGLMGLAGVHPAAGARCSYRHRNIVFRVPEGVCDWAGKALEAAAEAARGDESTIPPPPPVVRYYALVYSAALGGARVHAVIYHDPSDSGCTDGVLLVGDADSVRVAVDCLPASLDPSGVAEMLRAAGVRAPALAERIAGLARSLRPPRNRL